MYLSTIRNELSGHWSAEQEELKKRKNQEIPIVTQTLMWTHGAKIIRRVLTITILMGLLPSVLGATSVTSMRDILSEATALHAKLMAMVQPSVRLWISEQGRKLRQAPADERTLRAAVQERFAGQSTENIEVVAFLVLMEATNDMDKDLKAIMEELKAITAAKQKLQEFVSRVKKDVAKNAGKKGIETCAPPACGGYHTAIQEVAAALNRTRTQTPLVIREPVNIQQLRSLADDLKHKLDEMSEMSEMTSLDLQMTMERRGKFISTLSNIMKKISTTQNTMIQNLK